MGVGGGIVMVPSMVILMGIEQVVAQGISLAVIVPTALSGAFQHYRLGNVDVRRALTIGGRWSVRRVRRRADCPAAPWTGAARAFRRLPAVLLAAHAGRSGLGEAAAAAGGMTPRTEEGAHKGYPYETTR